MLTIFDCDGVLIDSEIIALQVLSQMMGEYGVPMSVAECQDAFMGMHNADILRAIEARIGRSLPGEGPRLRARIMDRFKDELRPVPGIADALGQLDGPRCVASSSDRARIELTLELTGLAPFFDGHIFSGTEVARGKPAPDIFLHAAAAMGFAPADCIVVEDSVMGVRAGVAAGMAVIGFSGGAHGNDAVEARLLAAGATRVISRMADLPATLLTVKA